MLVRQKEGWNQKERGSETDKYRLHETDLTIASDCKAGYTCFRGVSDYHGHPWTSGESVSGNAEKANPKNWFELTPGISSRHKLMNLRNICIAA